MGLTFGDWLRSKRGRRGEPGFIPQADLAARVGVDRTFVVQLENSDHLPTHATRERIHAALGTTEDELIDLGIVRPATMRVGTATATARAESAPDDPLAALVATFTPRQREMLLSLLDQANARALDDEAARRTPKRQEETP